MREYFTRPRKRYYRTTNIFVSISLAEPIDDHISVAVPGGAGEEGCLGRLLTVTLRAVAGNGELAEAVLSNGLDFGIGSQSASD